MVMINLGSGTRRVMSSAAFLAFLVLVLPAACSRTAGWSRCIEGRTGRHDAGMEG